MQNSIINRRNFIAATGATALVTEVKSAEVDKKDLGSKPIRVGIISASIRGKAQKTNGHTWHFAQGFHPQVNLAAVKKHLSAGPIELFEKYFRNQDIHFARLPFNNTKISAIYDADPASAAAFAEGFPGVEVARSLDELVKNSDAIWLGDASGYGDDHFELLAPCLQAGLPTFCDKPIGETVLGTKKILDYAKKNKAPLMSSSLFRHQWGTEEALRMKKSGEFGPLQYVIASQAGGWSLPSWHVYGQHPVWMVMTLCGSGVDAVNMYARENTCRALITYKDRMPGEVWYGRPDMSKFYCHTSASFTKKTYAWTPAIEDHYWLGHHYQIFRMADVFLEMVRTRVEPVPHQEILEVTAIIHAAAKSLNEKSRLVNLEEVMG